MPTVVYKIPNFLGGVSQQPDSVRRIDQATEVQNCLLSPSHGLKKRDGSDFISEISGISSATDANFYAFETSDRSRFLLAIVRVNGVTALRMYDVSDGSQKFIESWNPSNEGESQYSFSKEYYEDTAPADLRVINIGNTIIIVNTQKTPTFETDDSILATARNAAVNNDGALADRRERTFETIEDYAAANGGYPTYLGATVGYSPEDYDGTTGQSPNTITRLYGGLWRSTGSKAWPNPPKVNEFDPTMWDLLNDGDVLKQPVVTDIGEDAPFVEGDIYRVPNVGSIGFTYYKVSSVEAVALPASNPKKLIWIPAYQKNVEVTKFKDGTMPLSVVYNPTPKQFQKTPIFYNNAWHLTSGASLPESSVPSFVSSGSAGHINDAGFFRGRLVFAVGEGIVTSQADDLFNFWPSSIGGDIVDSDPIDITVSSNGSAVIKQIVPFNKMLVLFSDDKQFELSADQVLSPSTVAITESTTYSSDTAVRSVTIGNSLIFVAEQYGGSRVYEYFYDDSLQNNTAFESTQALPSYIPSGVRQLLGSTLSDAYYALTGTDNTIYVHNFFWSGGKRAQSAWSKYTFSHASKILGAFIFRDELFIIPQYPSGAVGLERMRVREFEVHTVAGQNLTVRLDRRDSVSLTGVYTASTDTTAWTLPYAMDAGVALIDAEGALILPTVSGTTATTTGDWSGAAINFVGYTFDSYVELSRQFFRRNGSAVLEGRMQLLRLTTQHKDTGFYAIDINRDNSSSKRSKFGAERVGQSLFNAPAVEQTGSITTPVRSQSDKVLIRLGDAGSDSYTGFNLMDGTIVAEYSSRVQ